MQKRLYVIVEGKSESIFVKDILAKYIAEHTQQKLMVYPIQNETSSGYKGGVVNYKKLIDNISIQAKITPDGYLSTFIDYYGLSKVNFPQYETINHKHIDVYEKISQFEKQMIIDVKNDKRFIPYIQLHEFEALYFADSERFLKIDPRWNETHKTEISTILTSFKSKPELINDNYETAPSKRFQNKLKYSKVHHTNLFVQYLENHQLINDSITKMSKMCPHFNEWLTKLLKLVE